MSTFDNLWRKLAKSKKYREEFVVAQVKRGIPFQIRSLLKQTGLSQEELAARAGLTQGVISRAANLEYGNLTLNTIIRVAAGFDVAFIGKFVPFSELGRWFINLSEAEKIKSFAEEDQERQVESAASELLVDIGQFRARKHDGVAPLTASASASMAQGNSTRGGATSEVPKIPPSSASANVATGMMSWRS